MSLNLSSFVLISLTGLLNAVLSNSKESQSFLQQDVFGNFEIIAPNNFHNDFFVFLGPIFICISLSQCTVVNQ